MTDGPDIKLDSTPYETLLAEVKWLRTAYENSETNESISSEFRKGFAAAIGWVEFHANQISDNPVVVVTHSCPFIDGGLTPCCHKPVFELPRTDRLTLSENLVTCGKV